MKNHFLFSILMLLGLSSCDSSVQYNVYVKNSTGENLKVVFKSPNDVNNKEEQTIELKAGALRQIISTPNLEIIDSSWTTPDHCHHVAEYIKAFTPNNRSSKIKWCDKEIKFEKEDIGQAVFTLEYTANDF